MYPFGSFFFKRMNFVIFQKFDKKLAWIDIPLIVDLLFLHDVHIRMSNPNNNVFQWSKKCFGTWSCIRGPV